MINRDLSFHVRVTAAIPDNSETSKKIVYLISQHHLKTIFAEAILLFAVNGLIITHELGNVISGSILMIAGILLAVSALIYMYVHEEPYTFPKPPLLVSSLASFRFCSCHRRIFLYRTLRLYESDVFCGYVCHCWSD
jgi:hypothetical protein